MLYVMNMNQSLSKTFLKQIVASGMAPQENLTGAIRRIYNLNKTLHQHL